MSVIFPKPLPPLIKESQLDESGFTALEKITLQNAWRVIKRQLRKHARNIFLDFFTENEYMLKSFRQKHAKLDMSALHSHPETILRIYDRLIEECLDNPAMFHVVLSDVLKKHEKVWPQGYCYETMKQKTEAIEEYFKNELKKKASPTFYVAFHKLSELIQSYCKRL